MKAFSALCLATAIGTSAAFVASGSQPRGTAPTPQLTAEQLKMVQDYVRTVDAGGDPAALRAWATKYKVTIRPNGSMKLPAPLTVSTPGDPPDNAADSGSDRVEVASAHCARVCWSTVKTTVTKFGRYYVGIACDLTSCYYDRTRKEWICIYDDNCRITGIGTG